MGIERLRKHYEALICELLGQRQAGEAYRIADIAVTRGLWPERLHRPITLHPTTSDGPFFDPADFWFTSLLEDAWPTVRAELDAVGDDPAAAGFSGAGLDGETVRGGRWHQLMLWDRGRRFDRAAACFPATAELVSAIPEATEFGNGFVMLSWLQPGAWIAPHCGPTNSRARTHLGVRAADGARIRIADQERTWEEGRCFVFDDSYEHEVRHEGTEPRVVLLLDVPNPRLADPDSVRRADQESWTEEIETFMAALQLTRISRTGDGVDTAFAEPVVEFISSYLDTRGLDAVEYRRGRLSLTPTADGSAR